MHILFAHKNFPAQFGHIAGYLIRKHGFRCSFVSELPSGQVDGIERIQYTAKGGATASTHYCSRTYENAIWHAHGVYEALRERPDIKPDLVVGHSGFGSTLWLGDLYGCPIINYFEFFYHSKNSDLDFWPDKPPTEINILRSRARNATFLADLDNCIAGYSPTHFQHSQLPEVYKQKIEVIFDGIDTSFWRPIPNAPRCVQIAGRAIPADMKIITYVSRGFESMRGFDILMKVAKRICALRKDVLFVCVGSDRVCYGSDLEYIKEKSYREHVLAQDDYDLSRILFTGMVNPTDLAAILNFSDLHIYLTGPFVLSWSMMNAMACGCVVLGSATAPVMEMIRHGENGLLAGFFDVDEFVGQALAVLDDPQAYRPLREAAVAMIRESYSLDVCLPKMLALYERALS